MTTIKLTYFDFNGGRAEPVRMALAIGNIDYEDHRISFAEFAEMRDGFPLKAVPTLEIDGTLYTQSNAMTRYAGKLSGLYPDNPWQAFLCDEILETAEDATVAVVKTFGLKDDELKAAREKLAAGVFTHQLQLFDQRLTAAGGEYFANDQLTVADLKVFIWLRALNSGLLDHVPTDLVSQVAPNLNDYFNRIAALPVVASYLATIK